MVEGSFEAYMEYTTYLDSIKFPILTFLGGLDPNNHIWAFWAPKYVLVHILMTNYHLIVVEDSLEAPSSGAM